MKIKRGTILKDQWHREWQAVSYDANTDKWELRLRARPKHFYQYNTNFIQENFQKVSD